MGNEQNLKPFKPGQSGNPNGRPPVPQYFKEARQLNKIELERILNEHIHMTIPELKAKSERSDTTALEAMVLKIISESIKKGDERRLNFLLDRLVGPVKIIIKLEDVPDEVFAAEAKRRLTLVEAS